jgi:hypothetical protein
MDRFAKDQRKENCCILCPWLGIKQNIFDVDAKVDLVVLEDAHVSRLVWNAILNVIGTSTRTA